MFKKDASRNKNGNPKQKKGKYFATISKKKSAWLGEQIHINATLIIKNLEHLSE